MDPLARRAVEDILGYRFRDDRHLDAAFTHASAREDRPEAEIEDYERLEFLGDAILQFVVTVELFRPHPDWTEGKLTRARSDVVAEKPLADAARRLRLNEFVLAGASVLDRPGRGQTRILSDVMEAVIGAVYVDSGNIEETSRVIRDTLLKRVPVPAPPRKEPVRREPARKALARREAPPPERRPRARKPTKGRPRERAPPKTLARSAPERPPVSRAAARAPVPEDKRDYKSELQNLLQTRHEPLPAYRVLREVGPEHEKIWFVEVTVGNRISATGKGRSKKEAEMRAARQALAHFVPRGAERSPL